MEVPGQISAVVARSDGRDWAKYLSVSFALGLMGPMLKELANLKLSEVCEAASMLPRTRQAATQVFGVFSAG